MIESVQIQLRQAGLLLEKPLVFGRLQRIAAVNSSGKRKPKAGWYSLFEYTRRNGETIISGAYGNHTTGVSEKIEHEAREWSPAEREEYRQKMAEQQAAAEQAKQEAVEACIKRANKLWPTLATDAVNPYLNRKKVRAYGVRFCAGKLVVPVYKDARLVSLQWIEADGSKKFMTGTPKKGAYFLIGAIGNNAPDIALVEGYATGATVHMATGWPVVVAFDAGNLEPVAKMIRAKFPHSKIIICADCDESGVGEVKARAAAATVGAIVVMPEFGEPA